uniref:Uncharacterized protein n=1 Tax=Arundo donax TaxID=35708 RepID=A0A0A8Y9V5_ARUDO
MGGEGTAVARACK